MDRKTLIPLVILALFGFGGGVFSDQFLRPAAAATEQHRMNGMLGFFDENRERMDMGVYNGQAQQNIYGADGKLRLQFGTYAGEVRENEKGLPSFTLYDNDGKLKMVLRLDGPNQGPLIIMKDNTGTNRMIMGLDIWDKAEEPFLVTWDKDGKQHDIVGNFVMKPL
ncbi:MAG: hypothetical protein EPN97_03475 [Alphaproteobacteria bacterium]|nr:MAG: hypothetical protein EPN97_03475 [Alphaproteobacteria bacterium]